MFIVSCVPETKLKYSGWKDDITMSVVVGRDSSLRLLVTERRFGFVHPEVVRWCVRFLLGEKVRKSAVWSRWWWTAETFRDGLISVRNEDVHSDDLGWWWHQARAQHTLWGVPAPLWSGAQRHIPEGHMMHNIPHALIPTKRVGGFV